MPSGHIIRFTPEETGWWSLCSTTNVEYGGVGAALKGGRKTAETQAHEKKR